MSRLADYLDFEEYFEFIAEWNRCLIPTYNPKPINISILFNGALTCLFCKYWRLCSGVICYTELDEIELFDEWGINYGF